MASEARRLGTLMPVGGGDPIPLLKDEVRVGRRPSNDVCLDFENVSGKHCTLRLENGVWLVRDAGSRNGTTINGQAVSGERGVMPDDEVGIATHLFHLDYVPASTVMATKAILGEELAEPRQRKSLLELAGLEADSAPRARRPAAREQPAPDSYDFAPDEPAAPPRIGVGPVPAPIDPTLTSDEDYYKLFEEEVERNRP